MADGTRRSLVTLHAERPRAVGALAAEVTVPRPAVAPHRKGPKEAGLVSEQQQGTRRIYRVNPAALVALRDQLDTYWQRALAGYAEVVAQENARTTTKENA